MFPFLTAVPATVHDVALRKANPDYQHRADAFCER